MVALTGKRFVRHLLTATLLVTALGAAPAHAAPAAPPQSIAAARALPLGSTVTVAGVATTPSGAFESSFYDKGFAIQDRTAGIYLKLATDLKVAPGRHARITGKLTNSSGLLTIVPATPDAVTLGRTGVPPRPEWRATGGVGEVSEGRLVRVLARITKPVQNDLPYGRKVFVDDGSGELTIFVNTQTGIDLSRLRVGQWVRVSGFSSQYDTHYEIDPRFPRDLVVLPG
ncbi:single stranded DNA-binding domain-containing protein [Crossiella cryophila]|uniref:Multidrug efflux pump subunit AcrA (Membrane-fusion protein) n=1 Tax=Crossiella cryophila TaxID=43355 RepID=A0A7W7CG73_9PSEU|nr:hypothetical protein [Crossiella cryophila]MBB4680650.1 multidrug efflux pump subunit AcrA (membrane-fusion protein) [Crossiella cryophila]